MFIVILIILLKLSYFTVPATPSFSATSPGLIDTNTTVGDSLTMTCNPSSLPSSTVTWYQNGVPLNRKKLKIPSITSKKVYIFLYLYTNLEDVFAILD